MQNIDQLGTFYLGRTLNPSTGKLSKEPLLYDSKNFTTHAVCVGMTGSGKTGLGIVILEEAALDGIPAIIIDPKGDLGNLLLTFPNLDPKDFKPWVDASEAARKGMDVDSYAESIAKTWKEGLADWGEDSSRIKKFRDSVDLAIYTPASNKGIPLSILSSFAAPPKEQMSDTTAVRDQILSMTSSLLALLGIEADPIKSREHILISTIIQSAWEAGQDLDIAKLIQQVQKPPFNKIGALDIDTFYPQKDRMALSIALNSFLASPGFQAWTEGEPLEIKNLLYSSSGKPKLSILSIAHLSDTERMFFVSLLLNQVLTWMRQQPGTSSLRALIYMDEIFGFFPPSAMPPSKLPMLTLLKQARAYGVGIVLATQNPVDLDYKGLANCGTWFIGKLQTERDKARVLEGLKFASNGEADATTLNKALAMTGNRTFIMRSIYEKDPILFQTRWTLSYLRGPLTLVQIASLTDKPAESLETKPRGIETKGAVSSTKPNVSPGIEEYFVSNGQLQPVHYEPRIMALAKLHFVETKNKIDEWIDLCLVQPVVDDGKTIDWTKAKEFPKLKDQLQKEPIPGSSFDELPSGLSKEKNYSTFSKELALSLYQNRTLTFFQTTNPNIMSKAGEQEGEFRSRVMHELHERRDEVISKVREKYSAKISAITEKLQRAEDNLAKKQQRAWGQKFEAFISFLTALLGALVGRGITKGTISQTGTTIRRAEQIGRGSSERTMAENEVKEYQQQLEELKQQRDNEIANALGTGPDSNLQISSFIVRPKKSDISIEKIALLWWPK